MKFLLLFFLSICTLPMPMNAQTKDFNPKIVYRADGRAPDIIFIHGFNSWGDNNNIVAHALGLTGGFGNRTSAFIPTSPNQDSAMRFVRNELSVHPRGYRYYMYDIRADDNLYYLSNIVHDIYERSYRRRIGDELRVTLATEIEYTAYRQIHPSQIRGVSTYYYNNQGELISEYTENERYIDLNTEANNGDNFPVNWIDRVPGVGTLFVWTGDQATRASQVPDSYSARCILFTSAIFGYLSRFSHCCRK